MPETGSGLCGECWEKLISVCGPDYCRRCGRDVSPYAICDGVCPNCRGEEIHFDGIARAGVYAESLRDMVLAFKNDQSELDSVMVWLANSVLQTSGFFGDVDFFVPVPLHWLKRLIRGYNQSHLLARGLKHPSAKTSTDLARVRYTKAQPTMPTPAARARNVEGAFAVRYRHPFTGRRVCLVDDVKTTGATLNECAKTLKEVGALKVFALVLAVAGQNVV
jgi:ComF family protein